MADEPTENPKNFKLLSYGARRVMGAIALISEGIGLTGAAYLGYMAYMGNISPITAILGGMVSAAAGTYAGMKVAEAIEPALEVKVKMQEKDIPPGIVYEIDEPAKGVAQSATLHTEKLAAQAQSLEKEGLVR